jgi:hypothetical protein
LPCLKRTVLRRSNGRLMYGRIWSYKNAADHHA